MSCVKPIYAVVAGLLPFVKVVDNFDAEYEVGIFSHSSVKYLLSGFMMVGEFVRINLILTVHLVISVVNVTTDLAVQL